MPSYSDARQLWAPSRLPVTSYDHTNTLLAPDCECVHFVKRDLTATYAVHLESLTRAARIGRIHLLSTEVSTSADLRVLLCHISIHRAEVQPAPILVPRGMVEWPRVALLNFPPPRTSIEATVWHMAVHLTRLKSGMILPAVRKTTIIA